MNSAGDRALIPAQTRAQAPAGTARSTLCCLGVLCSPMQQLFLASRGEQVNKQTFAKGFRVWTRDLQLMFSSLPFCVLLQAEFMTWKWLRRLLFELCGCILTCCL